MPVKYLREIPVAPIDVAPPATEGAAPLASSDAVHAESKEEIALAHAADGEPRTQVVEEIVMELHRIARHVVSASLRPVPRSVAALVVYFVKSRDGPISTPGPEETLDDYMTEALEYGSVNGDLLSSMVSQFSLPQPRHSFHVLTCHALFFRSSFSAKYTSPSSTLCWAASLAGARTALPLTTPPSRTATVTVALSLLA